MKKIFTILSLLLFVQLVFSKPVDEVTAKRVGTNFLRFKTQVAFTSADKSLNLVYKSASKAKSPNSSATPLTYFYVFNIGTQGFIMVSADDNAQAIIGYSNQGTFKPNDIPQSVAKWMEGYKEQIRTIIDKKMEASEAIKNDWLNLSLGTVETKAGKRASVSPLMSTTWNQSPYYNASCPGGSVTGCVATAMAQIMKYWSYPTTGNGFHSYNHNTYGTLSANFGSTTYQWSSMPNSVNSSNSAVATLMYHLGVSVDMNYSPQSSGAYVITSKSPVTNCSEYALKTYFGYNSVSGVERDNYTDAQWLTLLKTELEASRPILYAGFGSGGGHCFVADGYDNNNYIHFNWGWGGAYDGFFSMNALNPSGTGTGGGTGGFNSGHQAVINIQPPSGGTTDYKMALYDDVTPSASTIYFTQGFTVSTNFHNKGTTNFSGDFSAAVFDENYDFVDFIEIKTGYTLQSNYVYQNNVEFSTTGLVSMLPGTYYIGIFYRPTGGNWKQVENNGSYTNLVQIDVVNNNGIELNRAMTPTPSVFTQGKSASVNLNIVNNDNATFYGDYQVNLYDLKGNFIETIGTLTESNGLPVGYTYNSPYLTFSSSSITAEPGTYLLALLHKSSGGNWELTGTGDFQNPIKVDVQLPGITPDQYEANNTVQNAYNFTPNFSNNASNINTSGANCHLTTDIDYYKIVLPAGYDYTINPRLHDAYNSGNGNTYTIDALLSYSTDGSNWSDAYDNFPPSPITISNGGTVYFQIAPYFAGETGTYQLDIKTTRKAKVGTNELNLNALNLYPNPCQGAFQIDLNSFASVESLSIFNVSGQQVKYISIDGQMETLNVDVADLTEGIYFVHLKTNMGELTQKIVVVK